MSDDGFSLSDVVDVDTDAARQQVRNTLPWLSDPQRCDCGAICVSDVQWVGHHADHLPVWDCPECERRYHREPDHGKLTGRTR